MNSSIWDRAINQISQMVVWAGLYHSQHTHTDVYFQQQLKCIYLKYELFFFCALWWLMNCVANIQDLFLFGFFVCVCVCVYLMPVDYRSFNRAEKKE